MSQSDGYRKYPVEYYTLFEKCLEAIKCCNFRLKSKNSSSGLIEVENLLFSSDSNGFSSLFNWIVAQKITVTVCQDGGVNVKSVESESVFNKGNEKNLDNFFCKLETLLKTELTRIRPEDKKIIEQKTPEDSEEKNYIMGIKWFLEKVVVPIATVLIGK